ncbi:MAG: PilZ domain-containing protein, partial [Methylocella sp.]
MEEHGNRTIYLNEPLSMGLAPEGLHAYITQRSRWCLGAIQQIYTRWSFAGRARLRPISRLSSFDGTFYWIFTFPFKILMLTGPMIYWWTSTAVIDADASALIGYLAPSAAGGIIFICYYGRKFVLPVMTDVTQLLPSFVIVQTVIAGLRRPFGRPFKVTPKGSCSDGVTIQWTSLLPFAAVALVTFLGILINTSAYSELNVEPGFGVNVFWSIYNIAVLLLAVAVCIELPQKREDARLLAREAAVIQGQGQPDSACTIVDISLGGAKIAGPPPAWARHGEGGVLLLDGGAMKLPFRFAWPDRKRNRECGFGVAFEKDIPLRRRLTARLFAGGYRSTIGDIERQFHCCSPSASDSCDRSV